MKKNLLLLTFLLFSFCSYSQIVSIVPNSSAKGVTLPTVITMATNTFYSSSPPQGLNDIYLQLFIVRCDAVPSVTVHHEVHTLTHFRAHQYHHGLALPGPVLGIRHGLQQGFHVVAIRLQNIPAEGHPFCFQVAQRKYIVHITIDLPAVVVHRADEVIHLLTGGEHGGLPDLTFLQLPVPVQGVDQAIIAIHLLGKCCPDRHTESLSK